MRLKGGRARRRSNRGTTPCSLRRVEQVHHSEQRKMPAAVELMGAEIMLHAVTVKRPLLLVGEKVIFHGRLDGLAPAARQRPRLRPPPTCRYRPPRAIERTLSGRTLTSTPRSARIQARLLDHTQPLLMRLRAGFMLFSQEAGRLSAVSAIPHSLPSLESAFSFLSSSSAASSRNAGQRSRSPRLTS